MTLKELFDKAEGGVLNWQQMEAAIQAANAKFADLNEGNYVSKQKYTDELSQRDTRITTLTDTIALRDKDLTNLQNTLKDAGDLDSLKKASKDLDALQKKYEADTKNYQAQLAKQAYEFAVRDFANGKKFSSNAAKRDFVQSMIAKNLTMEGDKIIGADDFVQSYTTDNADAFIVEKQPEPESPKPQFVNPTQGADNGNSNQNAFASAFHFTGVRPKDEE